jgi:hypothetical protein
VTDITATRKHRTRRGVIAGLAVAACIGCCSIPFLAGLTIFGVAVCSTRFLGVAFGVMVAALGTATLIVYRRRKRPTPQVVPVELGPSR